MSPSKPPSPRSNPDRSEVPAIVPPEKPEIPATPSTERNPREGQEIELPKQPTPEISLPPNHAPPSETTDEDPGIPDPHF